MYIFPYLMTAAILDARPKRRNIKFIAPGAQLPVVVKKFKHRNTKKRRNSK